MKPYHESCGVTILNGDCREVMAAMEPNSIDAVICDPPYEISFMGRAWDNAGVAFDPATWAEALRVLKPGGYLLAFGGTRTSHRMVCAIEDAGFEVRDSILWLYSSGFPKSHNLSKAFDKAAGAERDVVGASPHAANRTADMGFHGGSENEGLRFITAPATDLAKQWDGWGTALSPSHEPICVARKPLSEKTIIANVAKWGTGGINIDGSRIGIGDDRASGGGSGLPQKTIYEGLLCRPERPPDGLGRWPKNTILGCCGHDPHDEDCPVAVLDHQSGECKSSNHVRHNNEFKSVAKGKESARTTSGHSDAGGASRFFYIAKASKRDRGEGNSHPTTKPTSLMRHLVKLVTPPGGVVLDPFTGSGSTGVAAQREGFRFIGIEQSCEYAEIAVKRLAQSALPFEPAPDREPALIGVGS